MVYDHYITFLENNLIIHKPEVPYEDKEWNALLNNGLLNHRWLLSHHDPDTDLYQVVSNLYGLNINGNSILDPQAMKDPNLVEEYLKCNEDI